MNRWKIGALCLLVTGALACNKMQNGASNTAPGTTPTTPSASTGPQGSNEVLAVVNGKDITDAEVTERVQNRLRKLESQIFDIKMSGLGDLIEEKLLTAEAEKRKVSLDELLKAEISAKVEEPSQDEVQSFYVTIKDRVNNQPLDKVKDQIVRQLKSTKEKAQYDRYVASLRKDAKVTVKMERPRIEVSADDDPSKGDTDAPIKIVEFSEFQCPFCKKARPTVNQILQTYGSKVFYTFRDFPLSFHKQAPKAAQAAQCANDQKKYWEYVEKLWENQSAIQIEDLKKYAKETGLNEKQFSECLDGDKYAAEIEKDINDGMTAGVSGTPAYFINGIFISGAQPFERFQEIIEEELARLDK